VARREGCPRVAMQVRRLLQGLVLFFCVQLPWGATDSEPPVPSGMAAAAEDVLLAQLAEEATAAVTADGAAMLSSTSPSLGTAGGGNGTVVFDLPITQHDGSPLGTVRLLEGEEAADKAWEFGRLHRLPADFVARIRDTLCQQASVRCSRDRALLFWHQFGRSIGNGMDAVDVAPLEGHKVEVFEGEELADAVYDLVVRRLGRSVDLYRQVADQLAASASAGGSAVDHFCTRTRIVVHRVPVQGDTGHTVDLEVLDGQEAVDALYTFRHKHHLTVTMANQVFQHLCASHPQYCSRNQAVVLDIALPHPLGAIKVPERLVVRDGEEPADVVDGWCRRNGLEDETFRDDLIRRVCDGEFSRPPHGGLAPVVCHRRSPILLQLPLSDENKRPLGLFTMLANEEPADAAYAFSARNSLSAGFRGALLDMLCAREEVTCNRRRAKAFSKPVARPAPESGHYETPLDIWEDDEPADAIRRFALEVGMSVETRQSLVFGLCNNPDHGLHCTRPIPALYSMPVTDETGEAKGHLHVLEGERPIDALLAFMKENKLAQSLRHPNLRRRLFGRLCGAAADAGVALDCDITEPRLKIADVELTYAGLKANLGYYFPDEYTPCTPIPPGFPPLEGEDLARAQRFSNGFFNTTEDRAGCLAPTRAAVHFFCQRLFPTPNNCLRDIHEALLDHLEREDKSRFEKDGPVGIDYYKMMRCPRDAPTPQVKAKIQASAREIMGLVENVSARANQTFTRGHQGLSSFREATNAVAAANATYRSARLLLDAARRSIQAARTSFAAVGQLEAATGEAVQGAREVLEGLRGRLLDICNETITRRNCSRAQVLVPVAPPSGSGHSSSGSSPGSVALSAKQLSTASLDPAVQWALSDFDPGTAQAPQRHGRRAEAEAPPPTAAMVEARAARSASTIVTQRKTKLEKQGLWRLCLRPDERSPEEHADAVRGCELLEKNLTWVCPIARERLPGLLPRYPVEQALTAANGLLRAWESMLGETRKSANAALRSVEAGNQMLEAGRSSRAIAAVSLKVARLNLVAANTSAAELKDDMEAANHRTWALDRARDELTVGKNREFYDKPCRPVFGACCARDQADGGLSILCG